MASRWYVEKDPFSPINYRYRNPKLLHSSRSRYQRIEVIETEFFGRMLVLDHVVQLTERDEFLYHEMLAHVPLHSHPRPERVLIIGGGDGGTLREVLKHPTVTEATLVELDPQVIEVSKRYFPGLAGSFSSPRVTVREGDGAAFLRQAGQRFDVVLVDSTDPVGPAKSLTTEAFFTDVRASLNPQGILAMQSESLHFHAALVEESQATLRRVFRHVGLYAIALATYAGNWWTFSLAAQAPVPQEPLRPPVPGLRIYSTEMHEKSFVPKGAWDSLTSLGAGSYRRPEA